MLSFLATILIICKIKPHSHFNFDLCDILLIAKVKVVDYKSQSFIFEAIVSISFNSSAENSLELTACSESSN